MCTTIASLNKMEPGIPLCPPNYTRNRKVGHFLGTPGPKDEIPTVLTQSLRPLKAKVQLIDVEKPGWRSIRRKEQDFRTFLWRAL